MQPIVAVGGGVDFYSSYLRNLWSHGINVSYEQFLPQTIDVHVKKIGDFPRKFELNFKRDQSGKSSRSIWALKDTSSKRPDMVWETLASKNR